MELPVIRAPESGEIDWCQECSRWLRIPASYGEGVCILGRSHEPRLPPRWATEADTCDGFENGERTGEAAGPLTLAWTLSTLCGRAEAHLLALTLTPQPGPPVRWVAALGTITTAAFESKEDAVYELEKLTR